MGVSFLQALPPRLLPQRKLEKSARAERKHILPSTALLELPCPAVPWTHSVGLGGSETLRS